MSSHSNKSRSALAVLAGLLLVLTGFVTTSADAATARTLSVKATPTAALAGTPVTFSGAVSRSPKGSTIRIQRKSGTTWVLSRTTTTTTAAGAYSTRFNLPTTPGTYTFRAYAPATGSLAAKYSASVNVVAQRPTTVTFSPNPTSIGLGATTNLAGSVSPFVAGTTVVLQKVSSGAWVTAGSTTVQANGTYSLTLTPTGTTTYRASVPAVGTNAAAVSAAATVTTSVASGPSITTTTLPNADKGVAYSTTLTKTGGAGTWAVTAGQLPAGITLAPATGILSGTPTAGGTSSFTVTFTETSTNLTDSKALSLLVTPPPTITTTSLPDATQGVAYSTTLTKTGNAGTWAAVGLPNGLSINPTTGEISGTTTDPAGLYGVYPIFTETASGRSTAVALGLTVKPGVVTPPNGPTITTTSLPNADRDVAYSTTLTKTGGAGTWAVAPGSTLPAGLSLAPATGVLSGTPTAGGLTTFTVTFTETSSNLTASKALSLFVTPPPAITTTSLPDATQGAAYSATLTKTGNAGTWAVAGLPTGLSVNPTTGEISGVTTVAVGDYPVFPVFTETASGRNTAKSLSLHVAAGTVTPPDGPVITTTTLPNGSKGLAYSASLTKTGGAGTWSITGTLPPGITLDAATGALTGVPTLGGSFGFTAKFTETTGGKSVTKPLAIFVSAAPTITTTALPDAAKGAAYSFTLTKVGGAGTWSSLCGCGDPQTPQALPDGLVLNENTGVISGTPTVSGDYAIYVAFTETATGAYAYKGFALHISVPVITTTSVPDGTTGTAYSQQLNKTGLAGIWTYTGALPAGLTLSSSGLLAGTPTETGDFLFTATFTETSTGQSDQQPFLLHVSAPGSPTITTGSALPTATIGTPYSTTVSATPTGGTWTVSAGSLPVGFALNPTTGVISGNPLYKENALFILKYTKGATSNTKVFSLSVVAAPAG